MDRLNGKTIYGFGDSLVAGHYLKIGMLNHVAEKHQMIYTNYAVNGGTIIPDIALKIPNVIHVWDVAKQIQEASAQVPDFICFDGLTNDAFPVVAEHFIGEITSRFSGQFDTTTFCGAFENICFQLRKKYQNSKIFYVSVHHMPGRQEKIQDQLHELAEKICEKWAIPVIDVYHKGGINTCIEGMCNEFSYDNDKSLTGGNGTHLNADGYRKWYAPMIETALLGYCNETD